MDQPIEITTGIVVIPFYQKDIELFTEHILKSFQGYGAIQYKEGYWYFFGPSETVESMYENMRIAILRNKICANIEKHK